MQLKFSKSFITLPAQCSFILCSTNTVNEVRAFLKKSEIDLPSTAKPGDADQKTFFHTKDAMVYILGIGDASVFSVEKLRRNIFQAIKWSNDLKQKSLSIWFPNLGQRTDWGEAIGESMILSNYQFLKYKTKGNGLNSLTSVTLVTNEKAVEAAAKKGQTIALSVCKARDLVNEPVITLTASELGHQAKTLASKHGFKAEVWDKKRIEKEKMGGLLAVNYGSPNPPAFIILEHKPAKAKNKQPVVFVGKGVVYDTGGLSLKPTPNSMDSMKSDMAGAAAVIGAFCAIADLKLPYHVIGLIPATDNRPGGNAYTPGDVIRMYDGSTVEVLNTDAEGRMILADALAYAKKYKPEVVVDLATLTGAAVVAVGHIGIAMMSTASDAVVQKMTQAGENTYERVVRFPLWDEYDELLKSDIADQKNIGGPYGGSITAAKFLQHFTDYPWVHLDIAGPAFLPHQDYYRSKNGTGVGVRLLVDFLSRI